MQRRLSDIEGLRARPHLVFRETSHPPRALPVTPRAHARSAAPSAQRRNPLTRKARELARHGYPYRFGGESPSEGGFDCSGVVHFLLKSLGVRDVPRVAYEQYRWLEQRGGLRRWRPDTPRDELLTALRPGDLLFWTGTYQTGRVPNISHVMVYMGTDLASGEPLMFGARSGRLRGRNGHAVDLYPFIYPKHGGRGQFVASGRVGEFGAPLKGAPIGDGERASAVE